MHIFGKINKTEFAITANQLNNIIIIIIIIMIIVLNENILLYNSVYNIILYGYVYAVQGGGARTYVPPGYACTAAGHDQYLITQSLKSHSGTHYKLYR